MNERSENGGVILAIGVVLMLVLLLLAGGGFVYVLLARQGAEMRAAATMARAAETQARQNLEQARAAELTAVARQTHQKKRDVSSDEGSIVVAIEALLRDQEQAWNAGDINQFMEHYWKSDELTFSSGGQTTRGWNATLQRYRERYSTPEKMGKLKLDKLEITTLGASAALVLGQWQVEREREPLSGNFSLVVRKFADRWLIIHDHTSRLAE